MVVGACLDGEGRPVSCEMWPGNHADAKALVPGASVRRTWSRARYRARPAVDRLRERFGIRKATVVADRGMISKEAVSDLQKRGLGYILGARMRSVNEVKLDVLSRAGRYRDVAENLRVKDVSVEGRRYVVCLNPEEAEKDRADREAILASLENALKKGAKALVGNRGYRRYLNVERGSVSIDRAKVGEESRYDARRSGPPEERTVRGKYVLRTNLGGRCGGEVQAALAGRARLQDGEVGARDEAYIPQAGRDDRSGPFGACAPPGRPVGRPAGAGWESPKATDGHTAGALGGGGVRGRERILAEDGVRRMRLEGAERARDRGAADGEGGGRVSGVTPRSRDVVPRPPRQSISPCGTRACQNVV